jgi:hypothetical protein
MQFFLKLGKYVLHVCKKIKFCVNVLNSQHNENYIGGFKKGCKESLSSNRIYTFE